MDAENARCSSPASNEFLRTLRSGACCAGSVKLRDGVSYEGR
jgi:hypothetical protein